MVAAAAASSFAAADYILDVPSASSIGGRFNTAWSFVDADTKKSGLQVDVNVSIVDGKLHFTTANTTAGTQLISVSDDYILDDYILDDYILDTPYKFVANGQLFVSVLTASGETAVITPNFMTGGTTVATTVDTVELGYPAIATVTENTGANFKYVDVSASIAGTQISAWAEISGYTFMFKTDSTNAGTKTINELPGAVTGVLDVFSFGGNMYAVIDYYDVNWNYTRTAVQLRGRAGVEPIFIPLQ